MKKTIIVLVVIFVFAVGLFFLLPDNKKATQESKTAVASEQSTKGQSIASEVNAGKAVMFDVRTPAEFNASHASIAKNFDSVLVDAGQFPQVSKNEKIYVYCRTGHRATNVKAAMENNGFTNVVNLGGLTNMKELGLL
jgi:phage shock protein E